MFQAELKIHMIGLSKRSLEFHVKMFDSLLANEEAIDPGWGTGLSGIGIMSPPGMGVNAGELEPEGINEVMVKQEGGEERHDWVRFVKVYVHVS